MHTCDEIGSDQGHCSHGCGHKQERDGSCRRDGGSCHSDGACQCDDEDACDARAADERYPTPEELAQAAQETREAHEAAAWDAAQEVH